MRSGYKITLGILTIMILVTITIGTSYAYYSVTSEQTNPNELNTVCFDVSYEEGSNSINLEKAYPMSETNALASLTPYTFTVRNNCTSENSTKAINYMVTLNTLTSTTAEHLTASTIRYKLNSNASAILSTAPASTLSEAIKTDEGINTSYHLASGTLNPGESATYTLYLWIDEATGTEVMGETYGAKVLVYSSM